MRHKICPKCEKEKSISGFGKNKSRIDGLQYHCLSCCAEYGRNYRKKNPDKVRKWSRKNELRRDFGLEPKDYDKMFVAQNGLCAICYNPESAVINGKIKKLAVDHNHRTGQIRGLLCQRCNVKLAHVEDIEFVIRAKEYLGEYDSV